MGSWMKWQRRTCPSPSTETTLKPARQSRLGNAKVAAIEQTCRQVAALFPGSLRLGLDVLIAPGFRSHAVLEANVFGDLLPGVLHRGQDTYTAQVAAWLQERSVLELKTDN